MKTIIVAGLAIATSVAWGKQPVDALQAVCTGLVLHAADIKLSSAAIKPTDSTIQREKGWKAMHSFVATVSSSPTARVAGDYKATGQRCQFDVSQDLKTVAVSKTACMALCKGEPFAVFTKGGPAYVAYFGVDGSQELKR